MRGRPFTGAALLKSGGGSNEDPMILNPFKGKNIIITGGSKGIGLAMARELGALGANLALLARDKETLQAAKASVEEAGARSRVLAYACDVTDSATLRDYIHMVRYEFGSIDGVIANSGYCHPGLFHELEIEDFDRQIDTNLRGVIYTLRHTIPYLLENGKGGFVALTSSPAGNAGIFGFSAYGPTKAAINNLAEVMRHEYGDRGIRVHLLLPPDTDTPGYRVEVPLYPPETKAILEGGSLLGPEYVAKKFVDGIANQKKTIAVGTEARFMLLAIRYFPFVWDWYVRHKIRAARESRVEPDEVGASDGVHESRDGDSERTGT